VSAENPAIPRASRVRDRASLVYKIARRLANPVHRAVQVFMATPAFVKKILRSHVTQWIISGPIAMYFHLVNSTGRIDRPPFPIEEPYILAMWHGRLVMLPMFRNRGKSLIALISSHRDGQIISKVAWLFNIETVAGSSSKGGSRALRELIRFARDGHSLFVTPDGPRGPRMHVTDGIIDLARLTGLPILPATMSARSAKVLDSWDRFLLPGFFTHVVIRWGTPIKVSADDDKAELRARLDAALTSVQDEADTIAGRELTVPA
jgi:lysophospholipid acyltransferase (LPLAT)-like uncharacterized protein